MKKEAKGKAEQHMQPAGRRIPIQVISTDQWRVPMRINTVAAQKCNGRATRILQLRSRDLDLGALITAVYQKLAA